MRCAAKSPWIDRSSSSTNIVSQRNIWSPQEVCLLVVPPPLLGPWICGLLRSASLFCRAQQKRRCQTASGRRQAHLNSRGCQCQITLFFFLMCYTHQYSFTITNAIWQPWPLKPPPPPTLSADRADELRVLHRADELRAVRPHLRPLPAQGLQIHDHQGELQVGAGTA